MVAPPALISVLLPLQIEDDVAEAVTLILVTVRSSDAETGQPDTEDE